AAVGRVCVGLTGASGMPALHRFPPSNSLSGGRVTRLVMGGRGDAVETACKRPASHLVVELFRPGEHREMSGPEHEQTSCARGLTAKNTSHSTAASIDHPIVGVPKDEPSARG